jgi:hypothetical protein
MSRLTNPEEPSQFPSRILKNILFNEIHFKILKRCEDIGEKKFSNFLEGRTFCRLRTILMKTVCVLEAFRRLAVEIPSPFFGL